MGWPTARVPHPLSIAIPIEASQGPAALPRFLPCPAPLPATPMQLQAGLPVAASFACQLYSRQRHLQRYLRSRCGPVWAQCDCGLRPRRGTGGVAGPGTPGTPGTPSPSHRPRADTWRRLGGWQALAALCVVSWGCQQGKSRRPPRPAPPLVWVLRPCERRGGVGRPQGCGDIAIRWPPDNCTRRSVLN